MAVVYEHIRNDNGNPLYVGICHQKNISGRPYNTNRRNRVWDNIVQQTGYEVVITHSGIPWSEAQKIEKARVKELGRIIYGTGILANILEGGVNEFQPTDRISIQNLYKKLGYVKPKKVLLLSSPWTPDPLPPKPKKKTKAERRAAYKKLIVKKELARAEEFKKIVLAHQIQIQQ